MSSDDSPESSDDLTPDDPSPHHSSEGASSEGDSDAGHSSRPVDGGNRDGEAGALPSDPSADSQPQAGPPTQSPSLRARVPDHIGDGCFSTGAIVITGPSEFVIDFLLTVGRPHKVTKRVVIPHPVMPQFIEALKTNLDIYQKRFGNPVQPPTPPPAAASQARKQSPQEIYDDLKLPDDALSGVYANGVMIGHGATEFGLDFLTSFFPQSAVSARVYLAAGQIPRLIDSLQGAVKQLEQRRVPPRNSPGTNLGPAGSGPESPNQTPDGPGTRPDGPGPDPNGSGPDGSNR